MKAFGLITILFAMAIAAYLTLGPRNAPPEAGTPQNAKHLEDKAREAVAVTDLSSLKTVIDTFQASKERYPSSLQELKDLGYIERIPNGVNYDPQTGAVTPADR